MSVVDRLLGRELSLMWIISNNNSNNNSTNSVKRTENQNVEKYTEKSLIRVRINELKNDELKHNIFTEV